MTEENVDEINLAIQLENELNQPTTEGTNIALSVTRELHYAFNDQTSLD